MIVHTRLESPHLAGNLLADRSERDVFVYLPRGRARERYQVALEWLAQVLARD